MLWKPQNGNAADWPPHSYRSPAHDWDAGSADSVSHFHELTSILRRRSRMIVAIAVLGTVLAAIVALLIPPKYTATSLLIYEPDGAAPSSTPTGARAVDSPVPDDVAVETHVGLLTSRRFLEQVAASGLPDTPGSRPIPSNTPATSGARPTGPEGNQGATKIAIGSPDANSAAAEIGALGTLLRRLQIWISDLKPAEQPSVRAVDELERHLKVVREPHSRVVSVTYTSTSPANAAAVVNRTAQLYVDSQSELKQEFLDYELSQNEQRIAAVTAEAGRAATAVQARIHQQFDGRTGAQGAPISDRGLLELSSAATASRQVREALVNRQKLIRSMRESIGPDLRIFSLASPPRRPSSLNPILFILPLLVLFTLGGSLLAVVRERLDRGMRSTREVTGVLGIPCIGMVPQLPRHALARPHQHLLANPLWSYTEAIRSIAAQLELTSPAQQGGAKVTMVCSSMPGEGKTTLAVSLAAYCASVVPRVLLVDFDFRHSSISYELGGKYLYSDGGIIDVLQKDVPPTDAIRNIPNLNLHYLPTARCAIDPLMLFGGDRFRRFMSFLRENYDCVILDGPPLLGFTEVPLVASQADHVLFAVKWGSTRREIARNALEQLRSARVQIGDNANSGIGPVPTAIVTQVNIRKHARYRYGDVAEALDSYGKYYSQRTV